MSLNSQYKVVLLGCLVVAACTSPTSSVDSAASVFVESLDQQDFEGYDRVASKGTEESFAIETGCLDWSTVTVDLTETPVGSFINAAFTDKQGSELRRVVERVDGEWAVIVLNSCDDGF